MKKGVFCSLLLAIGYLFFAPGCEREETEKNYIVVAHYYPWYGPQRTHWQDGYIHDPLLGEYFSGDEAVCRQHISWATTSHINVFSVSWWGPESVEEKNLTSGLLGAQNIDKIRFCILYETIGRLKQSIAPDFDDPDVANTFVSDMNYLADKFFSHPSYFKIASRPVVWFYVVTPLWSGDYEGAIIKAREEVAKRGYDVYLVADTINWLPQTRNEDLISCFDAATAYNMYTLKPNNIENTLQLLEPLRLLYEDWRSILSNLIVKGRNAKVNFQPSILPQYNDTHVRSGNTPMSCTSREDFKMMCEMAKELSIPADGKGNHIIWLTSFNEWHEGTTVEPTKELGEKYPEGNYQFDFLDVLREVFGPIYQP